MTKLILAALALDTLAGQYFHIWDTVDAYEISLLLRAILWATVIVLIIPYKHLMAKSLMFIFLLTQWWDFISYFIPLSAYLIFANLVLFITWIMWASLRSYEPIGNIIEPDKVYFIAHKPDSITGFFMSLFRSPVGGLSYLINHKVYGFQVHAGKSRYSRYG